jgi:hypothetical protein
MKTESKTQHIEVMFVICHEGQPTTHPVYIIRARFFTYATTSN